MVIGNRRKCFLFVTFSTVVRPAVFLIPERRYRTRSADMYDLRAPIYDDAYIYDGTLQFLINSLSGLPSFQFGEKKGFHCLSTFCQGKWIFSSKVTFLEFLNYIFIKRMRTVIFVQVAEISISIIQFFYIFGKLRTSQPLIRCYNNYYSSFHLQRNVTRISVKEETKHDLDSALLFIFIKI